MDLGERISGLRARDHMSQGDLAEVLDVSRQSISKWETNSSVPELDKLVRLSEVFGVSLDALVKGTAEGEAPVEAGARAEPTGAAGQGGLTVRKIVGIILLCFGFLVTLWFLLLGGGLFSLLFAGPFLCCGIICLTVRRRAGLWCAWSVYLCADVYLRYATGLTWRMIFQTIGFRPELNYVRLAIGWVQFLIPVILVICTLYSYRAVKIELGRKKRLVFLGGWAALIGVCVLRRIVSGCLYERFRSQQGYDRTLETLSYLSNALGDYIGLALLTALLVCGIAALRQRKNPLLKQEKKLD